MSQRPVAIVVRYSAGVGADILARMLGEHLPARLGQPVVIENRPGASGNIGTMYVPRSAPDGHTLLITTPSHILANIGPFKKFQFDPLKSFAPIIKAADGTFALVVNSNIPVKSLREYVEFVRARPGEMNYASPGPLTAQYFGMELLRLATGTKMTHVPYSRRRERRAASIRTARPGPFGCGNFTSSKNSYLSVRPSAEAVLSAPDAQ